MSWLEKLRNWNWDFAAIGEWFLETAEFHIQRIGWPAYIGIGLTLIVLGLSFPASRGLTALLVSGVFRTIFTHIQIVLSLVTVQFVGWFAKWGLSQFHRLRRWLVSLKD